MAIPWKIIGTLFQLLAPNLPEILGAVRNLKKEQQREKIELDDAALHLHELENRLAAQLHLIEQLTNQIARLETAFVWTLGVSIFAVVLAGLALGIVFFR